MAIINFPNSILIPFISIEKFSIRCCAFLFIIGTINDDVNTSAIRTICDEIDAAHNVYNISRCFKKFLRSIYKIYKQNISIQNIWNM